MQWMMARRSAVFAAPPGAAWFVWVDGSSFATIGAFSMPR